MVVSTARIIDAIIKSNDIGNIINVVIIGSTYIDQVGFDQGWNYTAIKSAQGHNETLFDKWSRQVKYIND